MMTLLAVEPHTITEWIGVIIIVLFLLALLLYGWLLIEKYILRRPTAITLDTNMVGAGLGAFAVVYVLNTIFPPPTDAEGKVSLKAFSLTFDGPAGPITFWALCFVVMIAAIKILYGRTTDREDHPPTHSSGSG